MSKRIDIILSDETAGLLNRLTTTGTRSAFISSAVLHYEIAGRNLDIATEWSPL